MVMNKRIILATVCLLAFTSQVSAEDRVTISDFVISAGETKELSITLKNEAVYAAFQFDLYLPEGLTVSEYSPDLARIPENTTLSMAKQEDGSYRFITAAMKANPIVGTSGGIVTVKVTASETLAIGSQTGFFRKVKLSKTDGTGNIYTEMSFPITVLEPSAVKAKSYERMYGEANPEFEFDVEGGVLDGTPEISCEATATSPVGIYDIIVKRGTETNYNVTYTKGTLTITKAPLTIKAGEYTRQQGEENPEFTLTYEGFKNDENEEVLKKMPEVICEADKDSEAGEYKVTVSGAEAQNYEITYKDGKLTVTAPEHTIIKGDANGDGTVTAADIIEVLNYIMGYPSSKYMEDSADANGDGTVNAADIVAIVNIIMGN
jgi:hypothetical protein